MDYVRVASVADVGMGMILPVEALGVKMLLTQVGGQFYAAQRKCPHLGFNLCRGSFEGRSVVCPLHKAKFDLATGAIERDPKLLFIGMKAKSDLKTYQVNKRSAKASLSGQRSQAEQSSLFQRHCLHCNSIQQGKGGQESLDPATGNNIQVCIGCN